MFILSELREMTGEEEIIGLIALQFLLNKTALFWYGKMLAFTLTESVKKSL